MSLRRPQPLQRLCGQRYIHGGRRLPIARLSHSSTDAPGSSPKVRARPPIHWTLLRCRESRETSSAGSNRGTCSTPGKARMGLMSLRPKNEMMASTMGLPRYLDCGGSGAYIGVRIFTSCSSSTYVANCARRTRAIEHADGCRIASPTSSRQVLPSQMFTKWSAKNTDRTRGYWLLDRRRNRKPISAAASLQGLATWSQASSRSSSGPRSIKGNSRARQRLSGSAPWWTAPSSVLRYLGGHFGHHIGGTNHSPSFHSASIL
jgi:hypothetical protein